MTSEYWDHIRIFENGKSFIIQLFNGAIYPPDAPKVWIAELKRDKIAHAEILHLAAVIPDGRLTTFVKDIRDRDLGKDLVLEYQYHPMPRTGTEPILPVSNVRKLWTVMKDHMPFIEYIDWKEMKRK